MAESQQPLSPSNPQPRPASNLEVIARRHMPVLLAIVAMLACLPLASATPIEPTAKQVLKEMQRPQIPFVPARVGWESSQPAVHFNLTLEQYGPQATARAVRASLLAVLMPDPMVAASLLFCIFALRWIRMRRQTAVAPQPAEAAEAPQFELPRAA
jgi:hypothetical protein